MKKKLIVVLFFLMSVHICVGQKKETTINWDIAIPIAWVNFKAPIDNSSPYDAFTYSGINYKFENLSGNEFKLIIEVKFDTKKSWLKSKKATDKLLVHEQFHFNITEIYARIFVKKLEMENALSDKKFSDKTNKIFKKTLDDLSDFQKQYDKETDHSKNEEKQKEWNEKLLKMLDENKEYAKREITFSI